jgi:hypothetical protein
MSGKLTPVDSQQAQPAAHVTLKGAARSGRWPQRTLKRLLRRAICEIGVFAPAWGTRRVKDRIQDIRRFALLNSEAGIAFADRRRIERAADKLLTNLEARRVGDGQAFATLRVLVGAERLTDLEARGVSDIGALRALAGQRLTEDGFVGGRPATRQSLSPWVARKVTAKRAGSTAWGGDRRSGQHTLHGSVLRMAVLLYCEAHAKPGFAIVGPLVRFANAVGAMALNEKVPFSPDAVRKAFQRMRTKARRPKHRKAKRLAARRIKVSRATSQSAKSRTTKRSKEVRETRERRRQDPAPLRREGHSRCGKPSLPRIAFLKPKQEPEEF